MTRILKTLKISNVGKNVDQGGYVYTTGGGLIDSMTLKNFVFTKVEHMHFP